MRRLFLLFLPLPLFAVICTIQNGENYAGEVVIHCVGDSGGSGTNTPAMSAQDCENLKDDVKTLLNTAEGNVRDSAQMLADLNVNYIGDLIMRNNDIRNEAIAIQPPNLNSSNIVTLTSQVSSKLDALSMEAYNASQALFADADEIAALSSQVDSYVCSDQNCSGSGSGSGGAVSCPCQEEFNRVLTSLGQVQEQLGQIQVNTWSNNLIVASIEAQLSVVSDALTSVTNRLNAPDDRMWGELEDIYLGMHSNLQSVAYSALNLQQVFYDIRRLIRGDGEGGKLNITTEGVIALVDSVLSMARNSQDQYSIHAFDKAVEYFSNTVSSLFIEFNHVVNGNNALGILPHPAKYNQFLYNVFTNSSVAVRSRFLNLSLPNLGGVTNWFTRMELYQQAQLGWFDTPLAETPFQDNQEHLTESSTEDSLNSTTNGLTEVQVVSSNLVASVDISSRNIKTLFSGATINAYLPTELTIVPIIEIAGESFGPVVWDTQPQKEICEFARSCTTLVWKVLFYITLVLTFWFVSRKVYLLVLYIIHIIQNL